VDDFIGATKNKQIYRAPSDCSLELARAVILDFLSRNWSATFGIWSNPVRTLLRRTSIKNNMLSSISGLMQVILECQFQRTSWTIQCPHSGIDRNWNDMFQFGGITNISNLLASELDFLKNCLLSGEFANDCWDVEVEVWLALLPFSAT
jgi:hypothetical protein